MTIDVSQTNQGGGSKTEEVIFELDTLEGSRKTMAEIVEKYAAGTISEQKARCLGYLMSHLLTYWKLEKDLDNEKEIEEIKQWMEEHDHGR